MALSRPLFVGFSSASRLAREGGDLEVTVDTETGPRTFLLPWFFVRDVDALLERWRRQEHEAILLTMNGGVLGRTLLQAAQAGGLRDTTFLVARGAELHLNGEWPTFLWASLNGHSAVVAVLLDAAGEATRHRDVNVALGFAAEGGHLPVLRLLLARGADVNPVGNIPDALGKAAGAGQLAALQLLLDSGATRFTRALSEAACTGQNHIVTLLLALGGDPNEGALERAAQFGRLETARLLLDRGANVHVGNEEPLRLARLYWHYEVVALLLERGAVGGVYDDPRERPHPCDGHVLKFEHKRALSVALSTLPLRKQVRVVAIIDNSYRRNADGEVEIDLDVMEAWVAWRLFDLCFTQAEQAKMGVPQDYVGGAATAAGPAN